MTDQEIIEHLQHQLRNAQVEIGRLEHALSNAELLASLIAVHARPEPPTLSPRERQVLDRLMAGDNVAEAARTLFLSTSTIKTYIDRLYGRLGVHSRAAMVLAAVKFGFVPQEDLP